MWQRQESDRLLQLWLTLPRRRRWTSPRFQDIHRDAVPVRHENGVEVRIYSGASGNLRSATRNYVPGIITESVIGAHATIDQDIPLSFNGFIYVIRGSIEVADSAMLVKTGQVGWLDRPAGKGTSVLSMTAGEEGARVVLYAGYPQGDPIVSHGAVHRRYQRRYSQAPIRSTATGNSQRMSNLTRAGGR